MSMGCRQGLRETSTYRAEVEQLVEKFISGEPGTKKDDRMTLGDGGLVTDEKCIGKSGLWVGGRRCGSGMQISVDVEKIVADGRVVNGESVATRLVRAATGSA
ncbi:hypothetical protein B0A48_02731 [Cryoendolithus antarcticus]|uniref:Uncharacterized protein n=1 Tax=Cryoendolithus antarcticus TaxID=1507870 RepID=A0A1V8TLI5_9PEZI|nr:hypothetical protein B0A48_02731 [Cryoendolithus antarcticus]